MTLLLAIALTLLQDIEHTLVIGPGKFEEPCFKLDKDQRLEFEFSAAANLDFNVHYHDEQGVKFAVNLHAVRKEMGVYIAPSQRDYCLMWTNHSQADVQLQYHYRIYQPKSSP